jgi:mutator family transposase
MARKYPRPPAPTQCHLKPCCERCWFCGRTLWIIATNHRTLVTLHGLVGCSVQIRACPNPGCERFYRPYHPEEESLLALPQAEFGLDVIAHVGHLRYVEHNSVPEIHQALLARSVPIAERSVTHLVHRYEELVTLCVTDRRRVWEKLRTQGRVILALDGLQPDAGHEILWVIRDVLSGEILLARSLLSATGKELAALLREVKERVPVPIRGVISDGQPAIRAAVAEVLPGVAHQLCQFHFLQEAAKPIVAADRQAKKELKKQVRGIRPIERSLEGRTDGEAEGIRQYCLAVRSALTADSPPPLGAAGLQLHDRLEAIQASIARVAEKGDRPAS